MSDRFIDRTVMITGAAGALFVRLDVADEASWQSAVEVVERHCGPLSVLINNAAYLAVGGIETVSVKELVPVDKFAIPRMASVTEIAAYVLFVASEDASFSTGSEFVADGGFALGSDHHRVITVSSLPRPSLIASACDT
jgi:NAD(P)-dependent dehydrogenase (short-subunit alcohol dehydrogenase family)